MSASTAGTIACVLLLSAAQTFAATGVGSTALVVRNVEGRLEASTRQLGKADPVYRDETVTTGDRSASEIRFLDGTQLTVGPNSSVVLDSFLFDPAGGKGTLTLEMAEGVFRFVSGKMPGDSYKVVTPTVSIGMRGTVVDFLARPSGNVAVVLRSPLSRLIVETTSGLSATLDRPGMTAIAFANGRLVILNRPPDWITWRVEEMRSLVASVRPWSPPPRNAAGTPDSRDGAGGPDGRGNGPPGRTK
jgi:hypothetical protein